ncbi:Integrase [Fulvimarina manganoxydans]|uniref:Integrase n=1 Tax=Fulvimarina manganoxydans TaxID=937218 RepID=A0A1W2EJ02_9HYPH|nr:tyrosine-type recombinase/integrase [Fulvimarina manganoxydans]SMD09306.1 Integrase [Fulvimarina manganoxydans]
MNDLRFAQLKAIRPTGKVQQFFDGGGLVMRVTGQGKMTWRLEYRFDGERRSRSLGLFPDVPLAEAREMRDHVRNQIARGEDPDAVVEAPAAETTFGEIVAYFIQNLVDQEMSDATLQKNRWLLLDLAGPLHSRPIAKVRAGDIIPLIQEQIVRGKRETAKRLRSRIAAVFDLGIVMEVCQGNPAIALRSIVPKAEVKHTAAITEEAEFGTLLRTIDNYPNSTIRNLLKMQVLCYTRLGEMRMSRWENINFDEKVMLVPKDIVKVRREHQVPLSRQAIAILAEQQKISGGSNLVFPQLRKRDKPLSENAVNNALLAMGYGGDIHTAHGFRSSASTILNERGFRHDVIEASLGHVESNAVRRAYNRAVYWKERVEMAQAWADLCDKFRGKVSRLAEIEESL